MLQRAFPWLLPYQQAERTLKNRYSFTDGLKQTIMRSVGEIASTLEKWAPRGSAQSYDNVGLQVGDPQQEVDRVLVALDLTPAVVEEALEKEAQLIITHHPLLFQPLKQITPGSFVSNLVLRLAEEGIAYYAAHTNLDAAPGGVSFALAQQLGLQKARFLDHLDESVYKLVTFVPAEHEETVRTALAEAGAGQIGDYEACAFTNSGTGYFRPGGTTAPMIGEPGGDLESVKEQRLEVEVARWDLPRVLEALHQAHPYEEVAHDVYPVQQSFRGAGLGVIASLSEKEPLSAFLKRVSTRLKAPGLRYAGDPQTSIQKVAVCGGAGSDLIGKAQRAGADAYVTADLSYHRYFEVLDVEGTPTMALIDAGHYETEAVTESLLIKWLTDQFSTIDWVRTSTHTSPMRFYTPTAEQV